MLCSPPDDVATDHAITETYRQSFFRIASRDDTGSLLYHRDLTFLMDISVQMSEFGLKLSLGKGAHFVVLKYLIISLTFVLVVS